MNVFRLILFINRPQHHYNNQSDSYNLSGLCRYILIQTKYEVGEFKQKPCLALIILLFVSHCIIQNYLKLLITNIACNSLSSLLYYAYVPSIVCSGMYTGFFIQINKTSWPTRSNTSKVFTPLLQTRTVQSRLSQSVLDSCHHISIIFR